MKQLLRELTPPMLWRCVKAISDAPIRTQRSESIHYEGHYLSWNEAMQASTGYDADVILQRTRDALLKVKRNEGVYERDSVVFDEPQHAFPLLAGLLRAAVASEGRLSVVDFGGSLGSSYFQCRNFLHPIRNLEWLVVDQPAQVACGREDFESDQLRFHNSVEDCITQHNPNVLLLSSVLQYLALPYEFLQKLLHYGLRYVIVDRTPFLSSGRERLTVQHVPSCIYPASYPAWFFNEGKVVTVFRSSGYKLVADFPASDTLSPEGEEAYFKGFIFEKGGG